MTRWWYQLYSEADQFHYELFYKRAWWDEVFLWLPKRCNLTGKRLWLTRVHRGTSVWTGPGDDILEHHYHEKDSHLIWILSR